VLLNRLLFLLGRFWLLGGLLLGRRVLLVVVDCEHVVVFDTVLEQFDGEFVGIGRVGVQLASGVLGEGLDVFGEGGAEGGVELGVVLVLAEAEDVVDEFEGDLDELRSGELAEGEGLPVVLQVLLRQELSVVVQELVELRHVLVASLLLRHLIITYQAQFEGVGERQVGRCNQGGGAEGGL
jgi:hypothetical protein